MKHFFKLLKYFLTYGPNEPALKIKSGDTIIVPTVDAHGYDSNGIRVPKKMMQSREDTVLHPSNLLTGPFYIEDVEVGDSLLVHIEKTLNSIGQLLGPRLFLTLDLLQRRIAGEGFCSMSHWRG